VYEGNRGDVSKPYSRVANLDMTLPPPGLLDLNDRESGHVLFIQHDAVTSDEEHRAA
jgi:hypothetical protein